MVFALLSVAQAQPVLRAAPPPDPGVIKRAPDQVLGVDASTVETLGGWVGTVSDLTGKAADSGAALVDVTRNDYVGSGGFRNLSKNRVNAYYDTVRGLSEKTRNSLPYKFVPQLYQASDYIGAVVDPLLVGDGRGAVSGAVNLGATSVASSAGAGGGAWLGTLIGGAVGSFVPVVGNVVGATVGGAIGTIAGGYVASAGYESYLKQGVVRAVEAGIAALIDPDTLAEAMQAKQVFLHQNVSPEVAAEWDRMNATSQSFGAGEVQMLDWGPVPYIVLPKAPEAMQQQTVLPDDLSGITSFELRQSTQTNYPLACTIKDSQVACFGRHSQGVGATITTSLTGTVSGNTLDVEDVAVYEAASGCTSRAEYRGRDRIVLEKGGRAAISGSHTATQTLRGSPCPSGPTTWSNSFNGMGTWRPN